MRRGIGRLRLLLAGLSRLRFVAIVVGILIKFGIAPNLIERRVLSRVHLADIEAIVSERLEPFEEIRRDQDVHLLRLRIHHLNRMVTLPRYFLLKFMGKSCDHTLILANAWDLDDLSSFRPVLDPSNPHFRSHRTVRLCTP